MKMKKKTIYKTRSIEKVLILTVAFGVYNCHGMWICVVCLRHTIYSLFQSEFQHINSQRLFAIFITFFFLFIYILLSFCFFSLHGSCPLLLLSSSSVTSVSYKYSEIT